MMSTDSEEDEVRAAEVLQLSRKTKTSREGHSLLKRSSKDFDEAVPTRKSLDLSASRGRMSAELAKSGAGRNAMERHSLDDRVNRMQRDRSMIEMVGVSTELGKSRGAREGRDDGRIVRAKAVFSYHATRPREMSFNPGDVLVVTRMTDMDWWMGYLESDPGEKGAFPASLVRIINERGTRASLSMDTMTDEVPEDDTLKLRNMFYMEAVRKDRGLSVSGTLEDSYSVVDDVPAVQSCLDRYFDFDWDKIAMYLFLLGLLCALVGFLIDEIAEWTTWLHVFPLESIPGIGKIIYWVLFPLVPLTIDHLLVKFVNQFSSGSGVPEIKAIFSGVDMPHTLRFTGLVVKVLGLGLSIGSGLFVGKQGPMLHIGVLVAVQVVKIPLFKFYKRTHDIKMMCLVAGAACGLAAHFGTPITGLLLTIELTPSYFPVSNYAYVFMASVVSSFFMRLLANARTTRAVFSPVFSDIAIPEMSIKDHMQYLVLALLMGIACGALAIGMIKLYRAVMMMQRRFQNFPLFRYPILSIFVVAILTSLITYPGWFGDMFGNTGLGLIRGLFSETSTTDGVSVKLSPILAMGFMFVTRFLVTPFSITLQIPCGLYAAMILVGAAFGRFVGEILHTYMSADIAPHIVAMIGGSAFVGSVTDTLSSAVVILEMTGDCEFIMYFMLATSVGMLLSRYFVEGIYEQNIHVRSLPYLSPIEIGGDTVVAKQLCQDICDPIPSVVTLAEIEKFVNKIEQSFFVVPVVDGKNGALLGYIKRKHLAQLVDYAHKEGKDFENTRVRINYKLNHVCLLDTSPLRKVQMAFVTNGLRFAFVTKNAKPIGIIQRETFSAFLATQHTFI